MSHGSKEGREAATPMWGRTPGRGNKGRPGGCQEQHGGEGTISRPLSLRGRESKPSCPSVSLSPPRRARPGCSTVLLESPPSSPATGPVSLQRPPPSTPPAPAYPLSPFGWCQPGPLRSIRNCRMPTGLGISSSTQHRSGEGIVFTVWDLYMYMSWWWVYPNTYLNQVT